ncbi:hypothetical protein E3N88_45432 [Mikania micrantha]|uniref:Uncharacterized protein n=1 Tax=Mikania micrantha TaxID=192012 RepID=A0A5N6L9G5_9ASTR|nr:hypothetical protein E3N88_45432 [Mikania micrantha]
MDIISNKSSNRLDTCLHLTAYILNPYFFYNNLEVRDDLNANDVVVDFVGVLYSKDYEKQKEILSVELSIYKRKQGKFDHPITLKGCEVNDDAFDPEDEERVEEVEVDEEDEYESDGVEIIEQYGQDDDEF